MEAEPKLIIDGVLSDFGLHADILDNEEANALAGENSHWTRYARNQTNERDDPKSVPSWRGADDRGKQEETPKARNVR